MKRAKLHRSHLQQRVEMKTDLIHNQKNHIINILDEYVCEVVQLVEDGITWDAIDNSLVTGQVQTVTAALTKTSTVLDQIASSILELLSADNDDAETERSEIKKEPFKDQTATDQITFKLSDSSTSKVAEKDVSTPPNMQPVIVSHPGEAIHFETKPSSVSSDTVNNPSSIIATPVDQYSRSTPVMISPHSVSQSTLAQNIHLNLASVPSSWNSSMPIQGSIDTLNSMSTIPQNEVDFLQLMRQPPPFIVSMSQPTIPGIPPDVENYIGQPLVISQPLVTSQPPPPSGFCLPSAHLPPQPAPTFETVSQSIVAPGLQHIASPNPQCSSLSLATTPQMPPSMFSGHQVMPSLPPQPTQTNSIIAQTVLSSQPPLQEAHQPPPALNVEHHVHELSSFPVEINSTNPTVARVDTYTKVHESCDQSEALSQISDSVNQILKMAAYEESEQCSTKSSHKSASIKHDKGPSVISNGPKTKNSYVPRSSFDKNLNASLEDFSKLIEKYSERVDKRKEGSSNKIGTVQKQLNGIENSPSTKMNFPIENCVVKGSILAGTVLEPDNPWSFYVQFGDELDQLEKEIRDYVKEIDGIDKTLQPVTVGHFYLAQFLDDSNFYRAKVTDVKGNSVTVLYCDYGNTSKVSACHIRPLPTFLATRPVMAMWCALAGAAPTNSENMWTEKASLQFQQMVCNQKVQIRVVQPSSRSHSIPHLVNVVFKMTVKSLHSDSQPASKPVDMSRLLIREKMAKAIGLKDQIATLNNLNQSQEMNTMCESLKGLDTLLDSMKKGSTSSVKSDIVVSGFRKAEPLCFSNIQKSCPKAKVKNLKDIMLQSSSRENFQNEDNEQEEQDQKKEVFVEPTPEQVNTFKLGCAVDAILCDLRDAFEDNKILCCEKDIVQVMGLMSNTWIINSNDIEEDEDGGDPELEFPVMVSEILTPNSFFVHLISEDAAETLSDLENYLTKTMSEESKGTDFARRKNKLCCTQFSKAENVYCRALILDLDDDDALVFAVDYGHFEWQRQCKMRALPVEFTTVPPLVLWCSLSYTGPCQLSRGVGQPAELKGEDDWPCYAVETFRTLVGKDKILNAVTTKSSLTSCTESCSFQANVLPIYLLDKSIPGDEVCLNHELIHRGLATVKKQKENERFDDDYLNEWNEDMEGRSESWNPMNEDFESIRNSYQVDVDDPGVAIVGYKPGQVGREGRRVCVFYNRPGGCYRGTQCGFLHTKMDAMGLSYDKIPLLQFNPDQSSILPQPSTCVAVSVSTIFSPLHFYITLPWPGMTLDQVKSNPAAVQELTQKETLETLIDSMQVFYRGSVYDGDLTLKAASQALAAKIGSQWLRAKVEDVDPDNARIQVVCVDFGDLHWVSEKNVRELEMRFMHLPVQAVECCLDDVICYGNDTLTSWMWGPDAVNKFEELVKEKTLVGIVKESLVSGRTLLSLIDSSVPGCEVDIGQELIKAFNKSTA